MSTTSHRPATVLVKKAGHIIPEAFLNNALTDDITCSGLAFALRTDGNPELYTEHSDKAPTLSVLMEIQEKYKASAAIFWFGRGEIGEESRQPFVWQIDGEDVMALFAEGDFNKQQDNNGRTDEHNTVNRIVFPALGRSMKYAGDDPKKLFEDIASKEFGEDINRFIGHRGVYAFLVGTGQIISHGINTIGGEFDWGMASQVDEVKKEKVEEPAPKKDNVSDKKPAGSWLSRAETPPATPPENTEPKPVIENQPKPEEPKTEAAAKKTTRVPIPTGLVKNDKMAFIRRHTGSNDLPTGWKKMTYVESVLIDPAGDSSTQLQEVSSGKSTTREKYVPDTGTKGAHDRKLTNDRPKTSENAAVREAQVMLLDKDQKQIASDFIVKNFDYKGNEIPSPLDIQKIEAKYGSFSKQVGFEGKRMSRWMPDKVKEFFDSNPKYAFLAFLEMRRYAEAAGAFKDYDASLTTENNDDKKPAAETKQPDKKVANGGWLSRA